MIELYKYNDKEQKELLKSLTIIVDTREKENKHDHILQFFESKKIPWVSQALTHGDYSCFLPKNDALNIPRDLYFTNEICIERKQNISEWIGNISQDRAAVKKKFALAPRHTILMIENSSYGDIIEGNYYSSYAPKSALGTFHSIWNEFDIPIIFMDSKYSGQFIYGYFYYYVRGIIK